MKVEFKKSFLKDLKKIKNRSLQSAIYDCILGVEESKDIKEIKNLKKLKGYDIYFRIKLGEYRIGIKVEQNCILFVVFEHRKDIYKSFP